MSVEPTSHRPYDEKEIGDILKRASELQGQGMEDRVFGLTSAEIARIAEEAGIESHYVAAAIAELEHPVVEDTQTLWGGPMAITLDRVVPGNVSDETWEAMIAEIRKTFRDPGHLVQRGESREWTGGVHSGSQQAFVTVVPCEGGTHLQVTWSDPVRAVPPYVMSGVLGLILIPVVFEALGMVSFTGLGLYLGLVAALLALARWSVFRSARRKKNEARQLATKLEHLVSGVDAGMEPNPHREPEAVLETHPPLLDLEGIVQDEVSHSNQEGKPTRQRS